MSESRLNSQLPMIFGAEFQGHPATEPRRRLTEVHCHIENRSLNDADQLALGTHKLIVNATQHSATRNGVVVLHEVNRRSRGVGERPRVPTLIKKAALVRECTRLDDENLGSSVGITFTLRLRSNLIL